MNRLRILSLVLVSCVCVSACATDAPLPPVPGEDVFLTPDTTLIRGVIAQRTTLDATLRDHGLAADVVFTVIEAARTVFDPRRLRSLQPFLLERTLEGALRHFEYEIDADSYLRVTPIALGADALRAEVLPIPKTLEQAVAAGTIDESAPSLFQAMEATGESAELTIALAQIFAGEIDFNTELQPGDRFGLAFERFVREDGPATYGSITAAEFDNDGRRVRAVRFTPPGGKAGLFRRAGSFAAPFLPAVAVEVRARASPPGIPCGVSIPSFRPRARIAASTTARQPGHRSWRLPAGRSCPRPMTT